MILVVAQLSCCIKAQSEIINIINVCLLCKNFIFLLCFSVGEILKKSNILKIKPFSTA